MTTVKELLVNGKRRVVTTDSDRPLLYVLREDLGLTGSKYGCGEGQCGACTVLVEGRPRRSCITPVGTVTGKPITTIEGLEKDGKLHPLQEAFLEVEAMQCAYCTSGMIMSALGLLRQKHQPSRQEIASFMQGNVCRCGTYPRILEAISRAAQKMQGEQKA